MKYFACLSVLLIAVPIYSMESKSVEICNEYSSIVQIQYVHKNNMGKDTILYDTIDLRPKETKLFDGQLSWMVVDGKQSNLNLSSIKDGDCLVVTSPGNLKRYPKEHVLRITDEWFKQ